MSASINTPFKIRRTWVKSMALIITGLSAALLGVLLYLGRPLVVETENDSIAGLPEIYNSILHYAVLAPSSHNAQPWRLFFFEERDEFILKTDPTRLLPAVDPDGREALLSLGAFLEHFCQAASSFGYLCLLEVPEVHSDPASAAVIRLRPASGLSGGSAVLENIRRRNSNKSKYSTNPLSAEDVSELLKKPDRHYFPRGSEQFVYLADQAVKAMDLQSRNLPRRVELASWMRFSDREARQKLDGLPAEQLGLSRLSKGIYYLVVNRAMAEGERFAAQSIKLAQKQVDNCAGFFVVTGEASRRGLVESGMNMDNLWLEAPGRGIALQAMSQILEEAPMNADVSAALGLDRPVQIIFRAGRLAEYGRNNKIRRPPAQFVQPML